MNCTVEQSLLSRIRQLSPSQQVEVVDFVEFLLRKADREAALERLLAIAPALDAAGAPALSEESILAEVEAARRERRGAGTNRADRP